MYTELVDAYLEKQLDHMLEDLKVLVRVNSQREDALPGKPFGEGPAKVLEEAGKLMEACGLKVKNYDNYVVTGDLEVNEKALDILAHLDVVPVTEDWTVTDPFDPKIVEDRIYGRGTADDKGPAIAALYAIRAMKDLNIPLKRGVRLILGSDEECGSSDLEYYYNIEKEAEYTFTPDAEYPVINLEKARLGKSFEASFAASDASVKVISIEAGDKVNVVPGKAVAKLQGLDQEVIRTAADQIEENLKVSVKIQTQEDGSVITVKGTAGHASTPEVGNNALTALLDLLAMLEIPSCEGYEKLMGIRELFPHGDTCGEALGVKMEDEISGALTMNLGVLRYSETGLYGEFDSRAPICATDENLTEVVRTKLLQKGITMESGDMRPAHHVPADSPFVQTLLESYKKYTGIDGKPLAIGGGTYVHELERGVAFGCMTDDVDNHMHGDDEFMEISNLLMSAKIFADVIIKLCC